MIVILCPSFDAAQEDYHTFVEFLTYHEPFLIRRLHNAAYCVETDEDLRYVFVDYRFANLFDQADIVNSSEFFDDLAERYYLN